MANYGISSNLGREGILRPGGEEKKEVEVQALMADALNAAIARRGTGASRADAGLEQYRRDMNPIPGVNDYAKIKEMRGSDIRYTWMPRPDGPFPTNEERQADAAAHGIAMGRTKEGDAPEQPGMMPQTGYNQGVIDQRHGGRSERSLLAALMGKGMEGDTSDFDALTRGASLLEDAKMRFAPKTPEESVREVAKELYQMGQAPDGIPITPQEALETAWTLQGTPGGGAAGPPKTPMEIALSKNAAVASTGGQGADLRQMESRLAKGLKDGSVTPGDYPEIKRIALEALSTGAISRVELEKLPVVKAILESRDPQREVLRNSLNSMNSYSSPPGW